MGAALKFKQSQVARQEGELARLKVVRGPDAGTVFVLHGPRATIGSGEENDVVLTDLKASRQHAELSMGAGGWEVLDNGSVNGITCNGKVARKGFLKTKDTLGLGETLFEFMSSEAGTTLLRAPAVSEEQVLSEQAGYAVQQAKVIAMSQFGGLAKNKPKLDKIVGVGGIERKITAVRSADPVKSGQKEEQKNSRTLLLLVGVLAAAYFLMGDPQQQVAKKAKKAEKKDPLADTAMDGSLEPPVVEKTAEAFYRAGFREYRAGNYLRARTQFETVLQMAPGHALAKIYLENANQKIEEAIKDNLDQGKKALDSGKLKAARGYFEAVERLLYRDPNSPAYIQAKDMLTEVEKREVK